MIGSPTGNTTARVLLALALVGAAVFALFVGFRPDVVVAEVRRGNAVDAVPGSVVVYADKDLQELKIEGTGRVVECSRLEPGKPFRQGDVLVKLDTTDIERAMAETKRTFHNDRERHRIRNERNTAREVAEQRLANVTRLQELGNASTENVFEARRALDAILTQQAVAEFEAKVAKENFERSMEDFELRLARMRVEAPMDGMVVAANVNVGTLVQSGMTVGSFYSNARVVIAKISEEDIARVKVGDPARVRLLSSPGRDFDAKVLRRMPFANPETRRYDVYLDVNAELAELLPNSTGEVTITVGTHDDVTLVPRRAVFNGDQVFVVRGDRIQQRQVELGFRDMFTVEVTKGLAAGERVVVENLDLLHDGQRVSVGDVVP